jgi:hypothetical protein
MARREEVEMTIKEYGYEFDPDGAVYVPAVPGVVDRYLVGYVSNAADPDARALAADAADEESRVLMAEAREEFGA